MIPYSIPLWTILTKWPPPFGPQCRYPRSAVPPLVSRPGVRAMLPAPGASCAKIGSRCFTTVASPPIIRQYPRSRPQTPPLVPTSTQWTRCPTSRVARREDIVEVVGVAAVDEDVAGREMGGELGDGRAHGRGRDHQPDRPWRLQLLHEIGGRRGTDRFGPHELFDRLRGPVVHHALM